MDAPSASFPIAVIDAHVHPYQVRRDAQGLEEFARGRGLDPVELVGSSGEEYQLLFTSSASPGDFESILKETASRGALRRIGVVERGSGVCLRRRDGSVAAVGATGWSHF